MDFVTALEKHNQWRRGQSGVALSDPKEIGEAIDQAIAETKRLRAVETLVNNLIDQRGRHNTEIAYRTLTDHMRQTKATNEET